MGSVSNTGFSIADLLQTVTGASSSESSPALSTPAVRRAVENTSPGDIVRLSDQAVQLQEGDQLFGTSTAAEGATLSSMLYPLASTLYPLSALLATLDTASPTSGAGSSTESLANQLSG